MDEHDHAGDGETTPPRRASDRAADTREALIAAALEVFGTTGFTDATISEISRRAGRAHGSFYTYFDSKEAIFREVIRTINQDEHERRLADPAPSQTATVTPEQRIARTNDRFVETYRRHARTLASYEELAARDDETRLLRRSTRLGYIERTIASIERWQADGTVDASIDAEAVAHCLGSMVERVAHMRFVFGDGPDDERMMRAISDIWCATLGLDADDGRRAAVAASAERQGATA